MDQSPPSVDGSASLPSEGGLSSRSIGEPDEDYKDHDEWGGAGGGSDGRSQTFGTKAGRGAGGRPGTQGGEATPASGPLMERLECV
jgi:hypothetical protein